MSPLLDADPHRFDWKFVGWNCQKMDAMPSGYKDEKYACMCGSAMKDMANITGYLTDFTPGCTRCYPNSESEIVLLMGGTNDFAPTGGHTVKQVTTTLDNGLSRFFAQRPKVIVFVAQTIPKLGDGLKDTLEKFNAQIPVIVQKYKSQGFRISAVDCYSTLDASTDLFDGIHLNESGMTKLGQIWYNAILPTMIELSGGQTSANVITAQRSPRTLRTALITRHGGHVELRVIADRVNKTAVSYSFTGRNLTEVHSRGSRVFH